MTTEQPSKSRLSRMRKKLQEMTDPTLEEQEQFAAERKTREGTMLEWAQMQANGDIAVRVTDYSADGGHGIGGFIVKPQDEDYSKAKKEYGLEQPGDTRHIVKKWIDGAWVLEKTEKTNASLAAPSQPSEGKLSTQQ